MQPQQQKVKDTRPQVPQELSAEDVLADVNSTNAHHMCYLFTALQMLDSATSGHDIPRPLSELINLQLRLGHPPGKMQDAPDTIERLAGMCDTFKGVEVVNCVGGGNAVVPQGTFIALDSTGKKFSCPPTHRIRAVLFFAGERNKAGYAKRGHYRFSNTDAPAGLGEIRVACVATPCPDLHRPRQQQQQHLQSADSAADAAAVPSAIRPRALLSAAPRSPTVAASFPISTTSSIPLGRYDARDEGDSADPLPAAPQPCRSHGVDTDIATLLESRLKRDDAPAVQLVTLSAVARLAAAVPRQAPHFVDSGVIAAIVRLLESPVATPSGLYVHECLRERSAWAVARLAGASAEVRDALLTLGQHNALPQTVPSLWRLTEHPSSPGVICQALWALFFLSRGGDAQRVSRVLLLQGDCVPRLLRLAASPEACIVVPAVRNLGILACGNDAQKDALLSTTELLFLTLHRLTSHSHVEVSTAVSTILQNLATGSDARRQALLQAGLLPAAAPAPPGGDATDAATVDPPNARTSTSGFFDGVLAEFASAIEAMYPTSKTSLETAFATSASAAATTPAAQTLLPNNDKNNTETGTPRHTDVDADGAAAVSVPKVAVASAEAPQRPFACTASSFSCASASSSSGSSCASSSATSTSTDSSSSSNTSPACSPPLTANAVATSLAHVPSPELNATRASEPRQSADRRRRTRDDEADSAHPCAPLQPCFEAATDAAPLATAAARRRPPPAMAAPRRQSVPPATAPSLIVTPTSAVDAAYPTLQDDAVRIMREVLARQNQPAPKAPRRNRHWR